MPQGTLDLLILKVVDSEAILRGDPGYAIAQQLQRKESETGRDAKYYRLTAKGTKQLRNETLDWVKLSKAVALVLQLSGGEPR